MKIELWNNNGTITMHKAPAKGRTQMRGEFLGVQEIDFPSEEKRASITVDDLIEAYESAFGKGTVIDPVNERIGFIIMKKELFGV